MSDAHSRTSLQQVFTSTLPLAEQTGALALLAADMLYQLLTYIGAAQVFTSTLPLPEQTGALIHIHNNKKK
jgi:hypothetical protein